MGDVVARCVDHLQRPVVIDLDLVFVIDRLGRGIGGCSPVRTSDGRGECRYGRGCGAVVGGQLGDMGLADRPVVVLVEPLGRRPVHHKLRAGVADEPSSERHVVHVEVCSDDPPDL